MASVTFGFRAKVCSLQGESQISVQEPKLALIHTKEYFPNTSGEKRHEIKGCSMKPLTIILRKFLIKLEIT